MLHCHVPTNEKRRPMRSMPAGAPLRSLLQGLYVTCGGALLTLLDIETDPLALL